MTLEQKRAVALASARLRLQKQAVQTDVATDDISRGAVESAQPQGVLENLGRWFYGDPNATGAERIAANPVTRFAMGAAAPVLGAAQLVGNLSNKQGKIENDSMQQLEQMKRAGGAEGMDIAGLAGTILSPVSLGAMKLMPSATIGANKFAVPMANRIAQSAAVTGGLSAAMPVTEGDFGTEKAMQVGSGVVLGALGEKLNLGENAAKATGYVSGKVANLFQDRGKLKAAQIIKESLGDDLVAVQAALKGAPSGVSASQAIADVNSPVTHAILSRAMERDPKFMQNLLGRQEAERFKQLSLLAKSGDQTAARQAQKQMKDLLNKELIPVLETEISAANLAGQMAPKLQSKVDRFSNAAASKVEDVRRFTAVQDRSAPVLSASAQPVPPRYTYLGGDLMNRAEQVATDAAEGSLRFGEAAQFADAALKSLEAHGLKPLKTEAILSSIQKKLADPAIGPNRDVQKVLTRVADDITEWTNSGGVIDGWALDTIRKASVNQAARDILGASADPKAVKELASSVLSKVRPMIVEAIEQAGGTGYGNYLKSYEKGMQAIGQTKLGAEAMRLYQSSPQKFVELIEGNSPKAVEKIFGPGNYDIAKQMSSEAMSRLKMVAGEVKRDTKIAEQVKVGQNALNELLDASISKFQIPNVLNPKIALANRGLRELEKKVGKRAMEELTAASKSGKAMEELLAAMPADQRSNVIRALSNPESWMPKRNPAINALVGEAAAPPIMNMLGIEQ